MHLSLIKKQKEESMEFFRKHQKTIILIITLTFLFWTVGAMLLPLILG